jgi:hypothetical protein
MTTEDTEITEKPGLRAARALPISVISAISVVKFF